MGVSLYGISIIYADEVEKKPQTTKESNVRQAYLCNLWIEVNNKIGTLTETSKSNRLL